MTTPQERLALLRRAAHERNPPETPDESQARIFARLAEDLTPWHVAVLKLLASPRAWLAEHGIDLPIKEHNYVVQLMNAAFPALEKRQPFAEVLVRELHGWGLLQCPEGPGAPLGSWDLERELHATDLGRTFLSFIEGG